MAAASVPRGDARVVADGFSFLEAPRWHDGRLFFSDFYTHSVHSLRPDGHLELVCEVPGRPSGLGFDPEGRLLVISMIDRRLLRWHGGALTTVADLGPLVTGPCNDMVVDGAGRAYVGNFGERRDGGPTDFRPTNLVQVEPDGTASVAARDVHFPNGLVITPDGGTVLVAETFAHRISAFDRSTTGALSNRRVWATLAPDGGLDGREILPDGMCLDAEGAVWIGDASGRGPLRVTEGGDVADRIDTGDLATYAVALGGPDRTILYMCAGPPLGTYDPETTRRGVLLACDVAVAGAGLP